MGVPSTSYSGMPLLKRELALIGYTHHPPPKGFSGEAVQPMGAIALPVTMGQGDSMVTTTTNFLVVKAPSSYNAILGRLALNSLKVVISTYHLKMKFPIEASVGKVRGEQILKRECYA